MYKQIKDWQNNLVDGIKRVSDNAFIPFDPDNVDYQEYLKFIADGGQPEPAETTE
jgi:hypothetical protein